jgi:hypothetical protein
MTPKHVDEASSHIHDLIFKGAPTAEVVTEAQRFVQGWRNEAEREDTHETFGEAVAVFRYHMQDVADELTDQLPKVEEIERDGFPVSIRIGDDNAHGSGFRVPIVGAVSRVSAAVDTYAAVVEALEAETPRPIKSLDSLLASEPFLRPGSGE